MNPNKSITLLSLCFLLLTPGCKDSKTSTESVSTAVTAGPTETSVGVKSRSAFPNQMGSYVFDGLKTKKHAWGEAYSASYKSPEKDKLTVADL